MDGQVHIKCMSSRLPFYKRFSRKYSSPDTMTDFELSSVLKERMSCIAYDMELMGLLDHICVGGEEEEVLGTLSQEGGVDASDVGFRLEEEGERRREEDVDDRDWDEWGKWEIVRRRMQHESQEEKCRQTYHFILTLAVKDLIHGNLKGTITRYFWDGSTERRRIEELEIPNAAIRHARRLTFRKIWESSPSIL